MKFCKDLGNELEKKSKSFLLTPLMLIIIMRGVGYKTTTHYYFLTHTHKSRVLNISVFREQL